MYGLKDNPFSTDPLTLYGTELPIKDTFVGRQKEIQRIKRDIYSNKSSRILVYGDVGVGKTSFVNYVKYAAVSDGYFTPFGEMGIQYDWSPEEFMFNTISTVYTTIERTDGIKKKFSPSLFSKLSVIFGTDRGYSSGGGMSAFGFGANAETGKAYGVPRLNAATLKLMFQDVLDELLRCGYKGVIIHYNNLELIQDKGENQLRRILNGIRDFLQVSGAHFVFVSDTKLYELFAQLPRVEDIFKVPVLISPFDMGQVKEIINRRISLLKIDKVTPILPYDDESLSILFKLYRGNLRGILRSLDCAVSEIVASTPLRISPDRLKDALSKSARRRYLSHFPKENSNTIKILMCILEKRETTPKILAEHFKMLPQNVSACLSELREVGAIRISREEGRSRYYVPSQEAFWLLFEPAEGLDGQQHISDW
jgi:DNA-binding transcriptional ArsR family regulator